MSTPLTSEMKIIEEPKKPLAMHPRKFAMWLFMASVMMLFASWTSAYIVRQAEGNWLFFDLPALFYYTTGIIVISSVTMQGAYFAARKDDSLRVRRLVIITAVLGVIFLIGQVFGWADLVSNRVHFVGNPSGSFVYVITGFHGLHIVSAVIFLMIVMRSALKGRIHSKNMAQMEMCTTYWHFLGGLWVYLFIFLLINR
ncbi:MAG: cytochrome c oxidase subunit 3 [Cytophagales bacterium]|nr:cytochrome c oxidase subunit 3 [Cytophagales bacterium]